MFSCDKCGKCCENLGCSELYIDLDDGTGSCIFFNKTTRLCNIYDTRPEKCRVDASYKYFKDAMAYETYLALNYEMCKKLKEK